MNPKQTLRETLLKKRRSLSVERQKEARDKILRELYPRLEPFSVILSFASKEEEVDLWPLNAKLAEEGRLALPYTEDDRTLTPYLVKDIVADLKAHTKWKVREPVPTLCLAVDHLSAILVPGLGFDQGKHRLGYGVGCYDRLLATQSCPSIGVGFKEQFLERPIPTDSHDIPLKEILLF